MTDNNIINLTPFRADLTRALARRGERLLAATNLGDEVATLEPMEAYYIVKEIGLDRALEPGPAPERGAERPQERRSPRRPGLGTRYQGA